MEHSFYCCVLDRVCRAVAWQRVGQIRYIALSLSLLVQSSLTVSFFLGFLLRVTSSSSPLLIFLFPGDYSPTATTVPSLRLLVPSTSLIRCQPVQVYYIILDLGFLWIPYTTSLMQVTILYGPSHENRNLAISPRAGWAIEPHSVFFLVTYGDG
jgi:hypothetical protein